ARTDPESLFSARGASAGGDKPGDGASPRVGRRIESHPQSEGTGRSPAGGSASGRGPAAPPKAPTEPGGPRCALPSVPRGPIVPSVAARPRFWSGAHSPAPGAPPRPRPADQTPPPPP